MLARADMAFNRPASHEHRPLRAESARLWAEERLKIKHLAALRSQFSSLTEQLEVLAQRRISDGQSSPALAHYVRCILGKMGGRLDLFVDNPAELVAIAKISVESFIADEEHKAELRQTSDTSEYQEGRSTSAQAIIIAWPGRVAARRLRGRRSHEATLTPWLDHHLLRLRMMAVLGALQNHPSGSEGDGSSGKKPRDDPRGERKRPSVAQAVG